MVTYVVGEHKFPLVMYQPFQGGLVADKQAPDVKGGLWLIMSDEKLFQAVYTVEDDLLLPLEIQVRPEISIVDDANLELRQP